MAAALRKYADLARADKGDRTIKETPTWKQSWKQRGGGSFNKQKGVYMAEGSDQEEGEQGTPTDTELRTEEALVASALQDLGAEAGTGAENS